MRRRDTGPAIDRGKNYRLLNDPEIARLIGVSESEEDPELTQAYPGAQGSEVIVTLRDGKQLRHRMRDLIPATPDQIRARFRSAAGDAAKTIEQAVDNLDQIANVGLILAG